MIHAMSPEAILFWDLTLAWQLPTRRLTTCSMLSALQIPHPVFAETEVPWLVEAAQEEVAAQVHLQKQRSNTHLAAILLIHQDDIPACKGCGWTQLFMRALAQLQTLLQLWNLLAYQIHASVWMFSLCFAPLCETIAEKYPLLGPRASFLF